MTYAVNELFTTMPTLGERIEKKITKDYETKMEKYISNNTEIIHLKKTFIKYNT